VDLLRKGSLVMIEIFCWMTLASVLGWAWGWITRGWMEKIEVKKEEKPKFTSNPIRNENYVYIDALECPKLSDKQMVETCTDFKLTEQKGCNSNLVDLYINDVVPNKYFKQHNICDLPLARFTAWKLGPEILKNLQEKYANLWVHNIPTVIKEQYCDYLKQVKSIVD